MTTLNITTLASNKVTLSSVQLSQVIEQLNHLSTDELVNVYIEYASDNSYETIYNLDESTINELYNSPWQALYDSNHKDFNDRDFFFTYNGNGHMVSFSNEDDKNCPIDIEELAQWIVDNELYSEYNIEVTTLDDMLASIEDSITDDENMLNKLVSYLNLSLYSEDEVLDDGNDWGEYRIEQCMDWLRTGFDGNEIYDIITHLNINYE